MVNGRMIEMTKKFICEKCGNEMRRVLHASPVVEWKCDVCGGFYITNNEHFTVKKYLKGSDME